MTQQYLIGIDGGSQSSKVSIFDIDGRLICSASETLRPICFGPNGQAVHPDDDIWDSIAKACRRALQKFPFDIESIIGIGLCTIRCCRVLLDKNGRLLMPVINWMDPRLSKAFSDTNNRLAYLTTSSGYITHRLCGEFVDSCANYEGMWPIDKSSWQWSDDPADFERCNTPRSILFDLVKPGELLGQLSDEAARLTGLPSALPVFATANDKAVEALGSGLKTRSVISQASVYNEGQEPSLLVSLGTYIGAMSYGQFSSNNSSHYFDNMSCIPGRYLHESMGIRQGMGLISWFRDLLGTSLEAEIDDCVDSPEEVLNFEAQSLTIGCDGLLISPDWLAPDAQPFKRCAIIGLKASHGRAHIYRAMLESIAMTMKINVDAMCKENGASHQQLLISGGGAKSALLMQIFADVFDLPVTTNVITDGAGLGAAMCAAVGTGAQPSFENAIEHMVEYGDTFLPIGENVQQYKKLITIFSELSSHTDVINQRLCEAGFQ